MSDIVQLIFSAVGTEAVAGAVDKVNERLGEMTRELGFLAVGAMSVEKAYEGVVGAMEEGVAFKQLSMRIGETIQNTVILDQAFRNAGLGGDMIGMSANMLQRALGGLNDMGGRTDSAFRRLGTSIESLKPLEFSKQLEVLSEGFAKLANQSDRVAVARQLFGRGGGQLLQLLGDPEALKLAAEQTGDLATRTAANAEGFHKLELQINGVKASIREMYLAAAQQLLPTLQSIASATEHIGFGNVGALFGGSLPGLLGAGIASSLVPAMDNAVRKWATVDGKFIGESFAGQFVAPLTGALRSVLPGLIIGLVAGAIVQGIASAIADANNKDFQQAASAKHDGMAKNREALAGMHTQEDADKLRAGVTAEINDLLKQRQDLLEHNAGMLDKAGSEQVNARILTLTELITAKEQVLAQVRDSSTAAILIAANQLKSSKESLALLVAQMPELEKEHAKLLMKDMSPGDQVAALSAVRDAAIQKRDNPQAGLSDEEKKAWWTKYDNERMTAEVALAEARNKVAEVEKKITDEEFKQLLLTKELAALQAQNAGDQAGADRIRREIQALREQHGVQGQQLATIRAIEAEQATADAKKRAEEAARTQMQAQRTALENQINGIRANLALIEGDYTRTDAEKWEERKKAIAAEISALQAAITADQLAAKNAQSPAAAAVYEQSAASHGQALTTAQGESARLGPDPQQWIGQTQKSLTDLLNSIGTASERIGQSIAKTIGGAFDSVSQHLTSVLVGTENWRRAVGQIGLSIETSIVGAIVDMGVKWVEGLAIMAAKWIATKLGLSAADKALAGADAAALMPISAAISAIWAPAAAVATIATYGSAAAAAPFEVSTAMLSTQAMAVAGFETGGWTGGREGEAAGIVHGEEFVFSAPATRNLGRDRLAALHAAAQMPQGAAAMNAAGGNSGRAGDTYVLMNPAEYARMMQEHSEDWFREMHAREMRRNS